MDWVAQLNLTGHNNREARTLARAVELGVSEYGAGYLGSKAAEVQLRRLLAIMVAAQSGSTADAWRGASQLEDLPGDGIGANLPAVVQKSLRESLKLEYQLEALLAGKMPDKGEKDKKWDGRERCSRCLGFLVHRLAGSRAAIQKRMSSVRTRLGLANAAIDALHELH